MAGYSGTPLPQKLGIKPGLMVVTINAPANYRRLLGQLPDHVNFSNRVTANSMFVHLFTSKRNELQRRLSILRKKSSGISTDVTEDVIREIALPLGFVDIKVCAVDETWSGLKLMIRRENRKSK